MQKNTKDYDNISDFISSDALSERVMFKLKSEEKKNIAAFVVIFLSLIAILLLIFAGDFFKAQELRTGAWTLFASIVGAALYHVFGSRGDNS